jgi:hypothetical protein
MRAPSTAAAATARKGRPTTRHDADHQAQQHQEFDRQAHPARRFMGTRGQSRGAGPKNTLMKRSE